MLYRVYMCRGADPPSTHTQPYASSRPPPLTPSLSLSFSLSLPSPIYLHPDPPGPVVVALPPHLLQGRHNLGSMMPPGEWAGFRAITAVPLAPVEREWEVKLSTTPPQQHGEAKNPFSSSTPSSFLSLYESAPPSWTNRDTPVVSKQSVLCCAGPPLSCLSRRGIHQCA